MAMAGFARMPRWLRLGEEEGDPDRVLVILQLDGGNDGLNTLVPWRDDRYRALRPALAIEAAGLLRVDEWNAFHPALVHLARRFESGQVACVQSVGYPSPNLSHFQSKDIWDTAVSDGPLPADGWMGRVASRSPVDRLAIGSECLPRSLRSTVHPACAIYSLEECRIRAAPAGSADKEVRARERLLAHLHEAAGDGPEAIVRAAYESARASVRELARVEAFAPRTRFPGSSLGRDLEAIARILGAGVGTRVFHVVQSGYDTHTDQSRDHAELLAMLDAALDAFLGEMEQQGRLDRTLVMTVSEFGRRARENGIGATAGTDHGAAGLQILCGGRVRGGVHGGQPDLDGLDANGNLVARTDFRQIYASVLSGWLGADAAEVLGTEHACLDLFRT